MAVEDGYRLFNCARCHEQVRICPACDHGQLYCVGACAGIRRRETLQRAGARYQRTCRGARKHAARQHVYRARRAQKVTHHGFSPAAGGAIEPVREDNRDACRLTHMDRDPADRPRHAQGRGEHPPTGRPCCGQSLATTRTIRTRY